MTYQARRKLTESCTANRYVAISRDIDEDMDW